MAQQAASPQRTNVALYYAGSLNAVISEDIGPRFTAATGFPLTNVSGPKDRVLQGDDNDEQIVHGDYASLVKTGAADAVVTYITQAIFHKLPYIALPDELDQSNPTMKEVYATVHYTNPQGQTFRGTPVVYSVTIPKGTRNQEGAEAFIRYLLSEPGRAALLRRGFPSVDVLVGGDETAVSQSPRSLIQGLYSL